MNEKKTNLMSNMKISRVVKEKLEGYKNKEGCKTLSDAVNLLLKTEELTEKKEKDPEPNNNPKT